MRGDHIDFAVKGAVHRAAVGDLHEDRGALARQRLADGGHGLGVFAAGEAVGKDRIGDGRRTQRQVRPSGKGRYIIS